MSETAQTLISTQEIAQTIKENTKPQKISFSKGDDKTCEAVLVPDGMELKSIKPLLDEYKTNPGRRRGTVYLNDVNSFNEFTNRYKHEDNTVLFADCSVALNSINASITSIFDYHAPNDNVFDANGSEFRAKYKFPLSYEFKKWLSMNTETMSQLDFALFLEEMHIDMVVADEGERDIIQGLKPKFAEPLEMLELCRDLEIYSNESVRNKNKLASGETEIKFTSEHVDHENKPIALPDFFVINVPIFEGGDYERVMIRLRYRLREGQIKWFYDIYRVSNVFKSAFDNQIDIISEKTGLPLFVGTPE